MRGETEDTKQLFSHGDMEHRIPADHPLRAVRLLVDGRSRRECLNVFQDQTANARESMCMQADVVEPTGPDTPAVFSMGGYEGIAGLEPFAASASAKLHLSVKKEKVVIIDAATESPLD